MRFIPPKLWAFVRLVVAGLIFFAVIAQFIHSNNFASSNFSAVNFFSYFTILSNVFIAFVFAIEAIVILCGKQPSRWLECTRGATVVYMVTTGIIFALLLSQYPLGLTMPWVNSVLHQIAPILAALDWILMPPRRVIPPRLWWSWLLFPLVYVTYTLLRGPTVNWYPYPFLNPDQTGGYGRVALYCLGITVAMGALVWLIGWSGNYLHMRTKPRKR